MSSPKRNLGDENSRAMMKANLILSKTIPKEFEHTEEIKYLQEYNNMVNIKAYIAYIFSND